MFRYRNIVNKFVPVFLAIGITVEIQLFDVLSRYPLSAFTHSFD